MTHGRAGTRGATGHRCRLFPCPETYRSGPHCFWRALSWTGPRKVPPYARPVTTELDLDLGGERTLHVYDCGPTGAGDDLVVFWHHGTPGLGVPPEPLPGASRAAPAPPAKPAAPPRVATGPAPSVPSPPPPPAAMPAPPTDVGVRRPSSGASPAASGASRSPSGSALKRPGSGMRSLDQVIVDYLASEAASEHLELSLTSDAELVSGGRVTLTLKATTSLTEKPLPGVHVSIRVVSTVRPPQILFRGVTAGDGCVSSVCALPDIGTGNAALIIAASSPLGNNEIKQLIKKKKGSSGGA